MVFQKKTIRALFLGISVCMALIKKQTRNNSSLFLNIILKKYSG